MNIIEVVNLEKSYGDHLALKGISFSVRKQSICALLGPNGAGKSTTLKILLGLRQPSRGEVSLFGLKPWETALKNKIGYTSQELSYPPHLKVFEVLQFVRRHFSETESLEALKGRLGLDRIWKQQVGGLSGGEKRRLGLACALVSKPEILILDEPTTGLDIESRHALWREIKSFQKQGGTVILSTHDLNEVSQVAEEILLIDQGQLLFQGRLSDILSKVSLKKISYYEGEIEQIHLAEDSDAFVQKLVIEKTSFRELKIHHATLEEAFLKIRGRL